MRLIFLSLCAALSFGQNVPFNPLNSLDWENLVLAGEISNDLKVSGDPIFRNIDGTDNNEQNPEWGSNGVETSRFIAAAYGDGFNSLSGEFRKNPREISNVIGKQIPDDDNKWLNERSLTQFAWQWGQFIDHDITLISEDSSEQDPNDDIDIYVSCGDPWFDDTDTCDADIFIEMFRTISLNGTPSNTNPRKQFNEITAFIDASSIYGSDDDRAAELRGNNGRLIEDTLGFLPKNTAGISNAPNTDANYFIAGDIRANEQLGLLTIHTIFVRLHNIIADEVRASLEATHQAAVQQALGTFPPGAIPPPPTSDDIYEYTKLIVTAIIQKITYKDWLPAIFGPTAITQYLGEYGGYDSNINPGIFMIFTSAAYRYGHSQLPSRLPLRDENCEPWTPQEATLCPGCNPDGYIELRDAFWVPQLVEDNDGLMEALLNGFVCTLSNKVDTALTDHVRNFLFESAVDRNGDPLFEHLDLLAINLNRGREHGLPDYNTVRQAMGLSPIADFSELSADSGLNDNLRVMYNDDVDDIDLFIGGLAEPLMADGSFGELFANIILTQFARIRDGDRFWYERYIKPGELLDFINCVTLKNVIELTTNIDNIDLYDPQNHNVFRNLRAISIFADTATFSAKAPGINSIDNNNGLFNIHYRKNPESGEFVIELTNIQIFVMLMTVVSIIAITCFIFSKYSKKNKNKQRYDPVKFVDSETDPNASDIEEIQS